MSRLRRDNQEVINPQFQRPLRIVASGTLFLTHTLTLGSHPEPSTVVRAHSVQRARGGSASTCLSIVSQFPNVNAMLVAPLGGNEEGQMIIRDLENDRVSTRYCKIWENSGVPSAWVLHADDTNTKTVINNNPLPDITHEEFVSLLGPVLVPENYAYLNSGTSSNPSSPPLYPSGASPRPSTSSPPGRPSQTSMQIPTSPAPLDWIHFEGRSVKTTLNNLVGLDGLAREKKWRSHCVFSIDVGRKTRQGVEALIPHADVVFLNKHYAMAHSRDYATSPRAFLLSLTHIAPPHALLVAHWGTDGAAVLSVPTKEYFQSSGWVEPLQATTPQDDGNDIQDDRGSENEIESVRSGSTFWAGGGHHTESSSEFTASAIQRLNSLTSSSSDPSSNATPRRNRRHRSRHRRRAQQDEDSSSSDSDGTQIAGVNGRGSNSSAGVNGGNNPHNRPRPSPGVVDEFGASDAFIAGMMYALTRRMLPGEPYTPSAVRKNRDGAVTGVAGANGTRPGQGGSSLAVDLDMLRGRWRLEECLRFATELAGRKARRKGWDGLAEEMARAGWFDG
ncbi:hypothetical protein BXZ70DRAFT_920564 [Cristinia sonorae]|uniref:Carbohydrate kinase PfkB domain-containing protein n=1 Tax=Cristinia sonorae TaxID=1940300 RepID=A0A8K0UVA7_9AGAR|nr:hypothetical protein BXZ70DRAFT_920564 [Cristinia sonorae]